MALSGDGHFDGDGNERQWLAVDNGCSTPRATNKKENNLQPIAESLLRIFQE